MGCRRPTCSPRREREPDRERRVAVEVDKRAAGMRLDLFLVDAVPDMSRKQAKRLIDSRGVAVGGRIEPMASRVMKEGESVTVRIPPDAPPGAAPPLQEVIFDDGAIVAVNKGPGLPSGPTRDPKRPHVQRLVEQQLRKRLTLLHRLDRDTTGALLLARSPAAAKAMLAAFRERAVEKTYLALVKGAPPERFEDTCHLREIEQGTRVEVVRSGGVRAHTRFRTVARAKGYAIVEARPTTGRMHQLRIQLSRRGYPIVGDGLYGGDAAVRDRGRELVVPRQLLHAWRIGFAHPDTGEAVQIEAPVPPDFLDVTDFLFGKNERPWRG